MAHRVHLTTWPAYTVLISGLLFKNVAQKSLKNKTTTKTSFLSNTKSLAYADRAAVLGKKLSLENVFLSPKFPDCLNLDLIKHFVRN